MFLSGGRGGGRRRKAPFLRLMCQHQGLVNKCWNLSANRRNITEKIDAMDIVVT